MTALVVLEHCNLNDTVTFSKTATTNLESGAVALGVSEGDQLTVGAVSVRPFIKISQ